MYLSKLIYKLSFLRLVKLTIGFIVLMFIVIPLVVIASTDNLQKLLKSELGIEISEQSLKNVSVEKQIQMEQELEMLQFGKNLFIGPTAGEKAIQIFTQLIENETTPDILSFSFDSLLKIVEEAAKNTASKTIAKSIGLVNDTPKYALMWGEIQAIKEIPRERLIFYYINERTEGKDDSTVWNNLLATYASYEQELGIKFSEGSIGILSGQIGAQINMLKDPIQAEALHAEAEYTYNSYILANEINNNPEAKEKLIQEIRTSIDEANKIKENKPSLLSRIWGTITRPFKLLWNKIVSLFAKNKTEEQPAQIGASFENNYQDCPAYIYLVGEYKGIKIDDSVIQDKIGSLNIGVVALRNLDGGKILISVKGGTGDDEAYQQLIKALHELGDFLEMKMSGSSAMRMTKCLSEDDFLNSNAINQLPIESNATVQSQSQTQQNTQLPLVSEKVVRVFRDTWIYNSQTGTAPLGVITGCGKICSDPNTWNTNNNDEPDIKKGESIKYISQQNQIANLLSDFPQSTKTFEVELTNGQKGWIVAEWSYQGNSIMLAEIISSSDSIKQIPSEPFFPNMEGKWNGSWKEGESMGQFEINFDKSGLWFYGEGNETTETRIESFTISGSLFGNQIFFYKNYPDRQISYKGIVEGNYASGTWNYLWSSGTWSMTKE